MHALDTSGQIAISFQVENVLGLHPLLLHPTFSLLDERPGNSYKTYSLEFRAEQSYDRHDKVKESRTYI
jgi:hypothetical protein